MQIEPHRSLGDVWQWPQPHSKEAQATIESPQSFLSSDLFYGIPNPEGNFGAQESHRSTFLLEEHSFELVLEQGNYVAIISDPVTGEMCTSIFTVKTDEVAPFGCKLPPRTPISKQLDATFWPLGLVQKARFQRWLRNAGSDWVLKERTASSNQDSETLREFVFEPLGLGSPKKSSPGAFLGLFSEVTKTELNERAQFVRISSLGNAARPKLGLENFQSAADIGVLPLVGTGENDLFLFGVPFLMQTRYQVGRFPWESPELYVSNGPIIDWLDPSPTEQGSLLRYPLQRKFRIRVSYRKTDEPTAVDLYINRSLFRRWSVKTSPAEFKQGVGTFEIDERVDLEKDFSLSVATWGTEHMPTLTTGPFGVAPFAMSRVYCVDANENGLCEAE